jgi:hypothetical protein
VGYIRGVEPAWAVDIVIVRVIMVVAMGIMPAAVGIMPAAMGKVFEAIVKDVAKGIKFARGISNLAVVDLIVMEKGSSPQMGRDSMDIVIPELVVVDTMLVVVDIAIMAMVIVCRVAIGAVAGKIRP